MKFLHTADWQLGARFKQFGEKAGELREARFTALRRALEVARDRKVDAFIIAGDLFEDNEVDDAIVRRVVSLFSDFTGFSTFILPGNHDPYSGQPPPLISSSLPPFHTPALRATVLRGMVRRSSKGPTFLGCVCACAGGLKVSSTRTTKRSRH